MQYSEPNTQNLISLIQDANTLLCTLQTYITTVSSRVHQLHNNYAMDKISSMCNHLREVVDFLEIETIQFSLAEAIFHTIKAQMASYLAPIPLAYLAATSKSMFKLLAPLVSTTYRDRKIYYFDNARPTNFKEISKLPIPQNITKVHFRKDIVCGPIEENSLPSSLTHLHFNNVFNQPVDHLPPSLSHLTFGNDFNQPVDCLPPSLTHLTFGKAFNQLVDHLPPRITHLSFGSVFNQLVMYLPSSITHLTFGHHFAQPLTKLPPSLVHLELPEAFIHPLDHLPPSVTSLTLLGWYDNSLNNIPKTVTTLNYGQLSEQHTLPPSLTNLTLRANYKTIYFVQLSPPLTHLSIHSLAHCPNEWWNSFFNSLPATLTYLEIQARHFTSPLDELPPALTHLFIRSKEFNHPVKHLPPTLTHLKLSENFNRPIYAQDIPNVTHLSFGCHFDQPIDSLPPSLTHLSFGKDFNQDVTHLPATLTHLSFGKCFNQPVDNLPPSLVHLFFGVSFNQKIDKLPKTLQLLWLGKGFDQPSHSLPSSLTHLMISAQKKLVIPAQLQELVVKTNKKSKIKTIFWQNKVLNYDSEWHTSDLFADVIVWKKYQWKQ